MLLRRADIIAYGISVNVTKRRSCGVLASLVSNSPLQHLLDQDDQLNKLVFPSGLSSVRNGLLFLRGRQACQAVHP